MTPLPSPRKPKFYLFFVIIWKFKNFTTLLSRYLALFIGMPECKTVLNILILFIKILQLEIFFEKQLLIHSFTFQIPEAKTCSNFSFEIWKKIYGILSKPYAILTKFEMKIQLFSNQYFKRLEQITRLLENFLYTSAQILHLVRNERDINRNGSFLFYSIYVIVVLKISRKLCTTATSPAAMERNNWRFIIEEKIHCLRVRCIAAKNSIKAR